MFIIYILVGLILAMALCVIAGRSRPWVAQVVFAALVISSTVTASKIGILTEGVFISVAVGLYSMTFLMTDFLSEIHGRQKAFQAVAMGFIVSIIVVFAIQFSIAIPPAPFWQNQTALEAALGSTTRILAASITAFVVAQVTDVVTFDRLKKLMNGRHLWLRNNASTFIGQTIDTVIFFTIAFYGVIPNLMQLIITTCIVKYLIALLDTPAIYAVRHIVNLREPVKTSAITGG